MFRCGFRNNNSSIPTFNEIPMQQRKGAFKISTQSHIDFYAVESKSFHFQPGIFGISVTGVMRITSADKETNKQIAWAQRFGVLFVWFLFFVFKLKLGGVTFQRRLWMSNWRLTSAERMNPQRCQCRCSSPEEAQWGWVWQVLHEVKHNF